MSYLQSISPPYILNIKTKIMKNIKDITLSIFAVIGFVAIISGFTITQNIEKDEIGRYQIAVTNNGGRKIQLYRVDTKTGVILNINERELEKTRGRNDNLDKQN